MRARLPEQRRQGHPRCTPPPLNFAAVIPILETVRRLSRSQISPPAYARQMKRLALLLTMFAAVSHAQSSPPQAAAPSVDEVKSVFSGLHAQSQVLQAASENLTPMAINQDQQAVALILANIGQFMGHAMPVYAVGNLLGKMRDQEDAQAVRQAIRFQAGLVIQQMDLTLKSTNQYMAFLKSPAAAAEAAKARDAMIASREQLRALSN
jgi:hypothetical protein